MTKARILLVLLLVCILGGLAWTVLRGPKAADPVYNGKHLSEWRWHSDLEYTRAVQAMGTNAVPYLIYEITAEDSNPKSALLYLQDKGWFGKYHIRTASERNRAAIFGVLTLGKTAVSGAIQGLTNPDGRYRLGSEVALTAIGESSPEITRALLARLNDDYEPARTQAATTLAALKSDPEIVIPAITRLLDDKDEKVRHAAAVVLGNCGAQAKPAVPKLLILLSAAKSKESRYPLEWAIKAIDPQAAAKAGIK